MGTLELQRSCHFLGQSHDFSPRRRRRRFKNQPLARRRMRNGQTPGVQRNAGCKRRRAAIFPVADDRIARMGKLQPDLMLPARLQLHLDERKFFRC
jgi:hypothetical protein